MKIKKNVPKKISVLPKQHAVAIQNFLDCSDDDLFPVLSTFYPIWTLTKTDLYHWVPVLNRFDTLLMSIVNAYDLTLLQSRPFDLNHKNIIIGIISFYKALLENSSNKSLFSSYDTIAYFLTSTDLDIMELVLYFFYFPINKSSSSKNIKMLLGAYMPLLEVISSKWNFKTFFRSSFEEIMNEHRLPTFSEDAYKFSFYFSKKPAEIESIYTPQITSPAPMHQGFSEILIPVTITRSDFHSSLHEIIEQHNLSKEIWLPFAFRANLCWNLMQSKTSFFQFLSIKFLALGIFVALAPDSILSSTLFSKQTDLFHDMLCILKHQDKALYHLKSRVLLAAASIVKLHSRTNDLIDIIQVASSHGPIAHSFTDLANFYSLPLESQIHENRSHDEFIDCHFHFFSALLMTGEGAGALLSSNIIAILCSLIPFKEKHQLRIVSKCIHLLDSILYNLNETFSPFFASGGLVLLNDAISQEISFIVENSLISNNPQLFGTDIVEIKYDLVSGLHHMKLKSMLKFILHMMQVFGNNENLRNLVETVLPLSVKVILANLSVFGAVIYGLSMLILSFFIHNEPTALAILIEKHVPQALMETLKIHKTPLSSDFITSLPHVLGAICINYQILNELSNSEILQDFLKVLVSPDYLSIMNEPDVISLYANSLEELCRYHPSLRPILVSGLPSLVESILQSSNRLAHLYEQGIVSKEYMNSCLVFSMQDITGNLYCDSPKVTDYDIPKESEPFPIEIAYIEHVSCFLEIILQNNHILNELFNSDCKFVPLLLKLYSHVSLPNDFATTTASYNLSHLIRFLLEAKPAQILPQIFDSINDIMADALFEEGKRPLDSVFFKDICAVTTESKSIARNHFYQLNRLHHLVGLFSDIFCSSTFPTASSYSGNVKVVITEFFTFLEDTSRTEKFFISIISILRWLVWEHFVFKEACKQNSINCHVSKTYENNLKIVKALLSQLPSTIITLLSAFGRIAAIPRRPAYFSNSPFQKRTIFTATIFMSKLIFLHLKNLAWKPPAATNEIDFTLSARAYFYYLSVILSQLNVSIFDEMSDLSSKFRMPHELVEFFFAEGGLGILMSCFRHIIDMKISLSIRTSWPVDQPKDSVELLLANTCRALLFLLKNLLQPIHLAELAEEEQTRTIIVSCFQDLSYILDSAIIKDHLPLEYIGEIFPVCSNLFQYYFELSRCQRDTDLILIDKWKYVLSLSNSLEEAVQQYHSTEPVLFADNIEQYRHLYLETSHYAIPFQRSLQAFLQSILGSERLTEKSLRHIANICTLCYRLGNFSAFETYHYAIINTQQEFLLANTMNVFVCLLGSSLPILSLFMLDLGSILPSLIDLLESQIAANDSCQASILYLIQGYLSYSNTITSILSSELGIAAFYPQVSHDKKSTMLSFLVKVLQRNHITQDSLLISAMRCLLFLLSDETVSVNSFLETSVTPTLFDKLMWHVGRMSIPMLGASDYVYTRQAFAVYINVFVRFLLENCANDDSIPLKKELYEKELYERIYPKIASLTRGHEIDSILRNMDYIAMMDFGLFERTLFNLGCPASANGTSLRLRTHNEVDDISRKSLGRLASPCNRNYKKILQILFSLLKNYVDESVSPQNIDSSFSVIDKVCKPSIRFVQRTFVLQLLIEMFLSYPVLVFSLSELSTNETIYPSDYKKENSKILIEEVLRGLIKHALPYTPTLLYCISSAGLSSMDEAVQSEGRITSIPSGDVKTRMKHQEHYWATYLLIVILHCHPLLDEGRDYSAILQMKQKILEWLIEEIFLTLIFLNTRKYPSTSENISHSILIDRNSEASHTIDLLSSSNLDENYGKLKGYLDFMYQSVTSNLTTHQGLSIPMGMLKVYDHLPNEGISAAKDFSPTEKQSFRQYTKQFITSLYAGLNYQKLFALVSDQMSKLHGRDNAPRSIILGLGNLFTLLLNQIDLYHPSGERIVATIMTLMDLFQVSVKKKYAPSPFRRGSKRQRAEETTEAESNASNYIDELGNEDLLSAEENGVTDGSSVMSIESESISNTDSDSITTDHDISMDEEDLEEDDSDEDDVYSEDMDMMDSSSYEDEESDHNMEPEYFHRRPENFESIDNLQQDEIIARPSHHRLSEQENGFASEEEHVHNSFSPDDVSLNEDEEYEDGETVLEMDFSEEWTSRDGSAAESAEDDSWEDASWSDSLDASNHRNTVRGRRAREEIIYDPPIVAEETQDERVEDEVIDRLTSDDDWQDEITISTNPEDRRPLSSIANTSYPNHRHSSPYRFLPGQSNARHNNRFSTEHGNDLSGVLNSLIRNQDGDAVLPSLIGHPDPDHNDNALPDGSHDAWDVNGSVSALLTDEIRANLPPGAVPLLERDFIRTRTVRPTNRNSSFPLFSFLQNSHGLTAASSTYHGSVSGYWMGGLYPPQFGSSAVNFSAGNTLFGSRQSYSATLGSRDTWQIHPDPTLLDSHSLIMSSAIFPHLTSPLQDNDLATREAHTATSTDLESANSNSHRSGSSQVLDRWNKKKWWLDSWPSTLLTLSRLLSGVDDGILSEITDPSSLGKLSSSLLASCIHTLSKGGPNANFKFQGLPMTTLEMASLESPFFIPCSSSVASSSINNLHGVPVPNLSSFLVSPFVQPWLAHFPKRYSSELKDELISNHLLCTDGSIKCDAICDTDPSRDSSSAFMNISKSDEQEIMRDESSIIDSWYKLLVIELKRFIDRHGFLTFYYYLAMLNLVPTTVPFSLDDIAEIDSFVSELALYFMNVFFQENALMFLAKDTFILSTSKRKSLWVFLTWNAYPDLLFQWLVLGQLRLEKHIIGMNQNESIEAEKKDDPAILSNSPDINSVNTNDTIEINQNMSEDRISANENDNLITETEGNIMDEHPDNTDVPSNLYSTTEAPPIDESLPILQIRPELDVSVLEVLPPEMQREILVEYFEERRRNNPSGQFLLRVSQDFLDSIENSEIKELILDCQEEERIAFHLRRTQTQDNTTLYADSINEDFLMHDGNESLSTILDNPSLFSANSSSAFFPATHTQLPGSSISRGLDDSHWIMSFTPGDAQANFSLRMDPLTSSSSRSRRRSSGHDAAVQPTPGSFLSSALSNLLSALTPAITNSASGHNHSINIRSGRPRSDSEGNKHDPSFAKFYILPSVYYQSRHLVFPSYLSKDESLSINLSSNMISRDAVESMIVSDREGWVIFLRYLLHITTLKKKIHLKCLSDLLRHMEFKFSDMRHSDSKLSEKVPYGSMVPNSKIGKVEVLVFLLLLLLEKPKDLAHLDNILISLWNSPPMNLFHPVIVQLTQQLSTEILINFSSSLTSPSSVLVPQLSHTCLSSSESFTATPDPFFLKHTLPACDQVWISQRILSLLHYLIQQDFASQFLLMPLSVSIKSFAGLSLFSEPIPSINWKISLKVAPNVPISILFLLLHQKFVQLKDSTSTNRNALTSLIILIYDCFKAIFKDDKSLIPRWTHPSPSDFIQKYLEANTQSASVNGMKLSQPNSGSTGSSTPIPAASTPSITRLTNTPAKKGIKNILPEFTLWTLPESIVPLLLSGISCPSLVTSQKTFHHFTKLIQCLSTLPYVANSDSHHASLHIALGNSDSAFCSSPVHAFNGGSSLISFANLFIDHGQRLLLRMLSDLLSEFSIVVQGEFFSENTLSVEIPSSVPTKFDTSMEYTDVVSSSEKTKLCANRSEFIHRLTSPVSLQHQLLKLIKLLNVLSDSFEISEQSKSEGDNNKHTNATTSIDATQQSTLGTSVPEPDDTATRIASNAGSSLKLKDASCISKELSITQELTYDELFLHARALIQPLKLSPHPLAYILQESDFVALLSNLSKLLDIDSSLAQPLLPLLEALFLLAKFSIDPHSNLSATPHAIKSAVAPGSPMRTPGSVHSSTIPSGLNGPNTWNIFVNRHRTILNSLIKSHPQLLTKSFSILINTFPKLLDFDNKRAYFRSQLHRKSLEKLSHYGDTISLTVRREHVFEDSYHQLLGKSGTEIKYGKLNVRFYGEEGVDAGGITREWFSSLSRQMFNPDYALFRTSALDRITYQPNRASYINPEHLSYFKFIGRIIGKAIYDVDYKDIEAVDPSFYNSLCWILEHDITDILDLTFSTEMDDFGVHKIIDLIPDGRQVVVTQENKGEYVKLVTEQKLTHAIQAQLKAFLTGFHDIIPADLLTIFNEQELELLISGLPEIDIDDWRNNTEYHGGYSVSSPQVVWFWRTIRSFDQEQRAKLLQFATGTSKVPLEGFSALQGSSGIQKFQIHKDFGLIERLPTAHTCFNQLDIPAYESYEELRKNLLIAMNEGSVGFGFA